MTVTMSTGARGRTWRADRPVDLGLHLGALQRGPRDPTMRVLGTGPQRRFLRAALTPAGPSLLSAVATGDTVIGRAWGEGADWLLDRLPRLCGADDDPSPFQPRHPLLAEAHRRHPHLRIGATDRVWEAMAPACLEQVVTGSEAFAAYRQLVREFGERAPGPASDPGSPAWDLWVPPPPEVWQAIPSWRFLAAGVEERRSRALVTAAARAAALERTTGRVGREVDTALRSLPGVGPWTAAEVRQRAHGDPDAWSIGDYHIPGQITYALIGEKLGDAEALEVLAPYVGQRYRVQLLLGLDGPRPPRRAPRMTLPRHTPRATRGRS